MSRLSGEIRSRSSASSLASARSLEDSNSLSPRTHSKVPFEDSYDNRKSYENDVHRNEKLDYKTLFAILVLFYGFSTWFIFATEMISVAPKSISDEFRGDRGSFIEERAREHLVQLTNMGPRPVGSYSNEVLAVDYLSRIIDFIKIGCNAVHSLDVDIQRPTGTFNLPFQDGFTSFYGNVTNVLVKFSSKGGSKHSLLVNCHFDTVPGSPGASDDAVNCALMLEILRVLSQIDTPLTHSIIFSFNGGEETILQAAHGFITQHKWRRDIRAFINLEACGAGGKEILFQAGPQNPWLIRAYRAAVEYPLASVIAEEIFQSGLLPADTDYRIFRDYGHIPGLDFAFFKNGFIYHTKYDRPEYIEPGSIQRSGENILNLVKFIANSSELADPGDGRYGRVVYFDYLGYYLFIYSDNVAFLLNLALIVVVLIMLALRVNSISRINISRSDYLRELLKAMFIVCLSWAMAVSTVLAVVLTLTIFKANMSWYGQPLFVIGLYVFPALATTILFISSYSARSGIIFPSYARMWRTEELYFYASQTMGALILVPVTVLGIQSTFVLTIWMLFVTAGRIVIVMVVPERKGLVRNMKMFITIHVLCQFFPYTLITFFIVNSMRLFIPILGRIGTTVNPDIIIALIMAVAVTGQTSHMLTLLHLTKGAKKIAGVLYIGCFLSMMLAISPFGFPYSADLKSPALQRYLLLHTHRHLYNRNGDLIKEDSGYWVKPWDYNGHDSLFKYVLTEEEARNSVEVDGLCDSEVMCGMPYVFSVVTKLTRTVYVPGPPPLIHTPLRVKLLERNDVGNDHRNLTFQVTGADRMTVLIAPQEGCDVAQSSLGEGTLLAGYSWHGRPTYFLFYSNTAPGVKWEFWINFKLSDALVSSNSSIIRAAFSSHHTHGHDMQSPDLRDFINRFPNWTVLSLAWAAEYSSYWF